MNFFIKNIETFTFINRFLDCKPLPSSGKPLPNTLKSTNHTDLIFNFTVQSNINKDMNSKNYPADLSYFRLLLVDFLRESHPHRVHFKLSSWQKKATFVSNKTRRVMTKEEYLAIASSRYEELETLNEKDNFYDFEKTFDHIWQDLGRQYLESRLNEQSQTRDRRKKKR
jgi:hypothetical protein